MVTDRNQTFSGEHVCAIQKQMYNTVHVKPTCYKPESPQ